MSSDNVAAILQEEGNDEGEVAAKGLTGWGWGTGPGRILTFNLFIWFLDSVLLYSPSCPGTCCVDQDDPELKILLALPLQCWIKGVHYYVLPKNFIIYFGRGNTGHERKSEDNLQESVFPFYHLGTKRSSSGLVEPAFIHLVISPAHWQ